MMIHRSMSKMLPPEPGSNGISRWIGVFCGGGVPVAISCNASSLHQVQNSAISSGIRADRYPPFCTNRSNDQLTVDQLMGSRLMMLARGNASAASAA